MFIVQFFYFPSFFEEYATHGINYWGLTMQNEPRDPDFPWQSMDLNVTLQRDFAYEHLAPELRAHELTRNVKIMGFDDNRGGAAEAANIVVLLFIILFLFLLILIFFAVIIFILCK
jgi:glucosylceramidase